jgi:hypothetical protein
VSQCWFLIENLILLLTVFGDSKFNSLESTSGHTFHTVKGEKLKLLNEGKEL